MWVKSIGGMIPTQENSLRKICSTAPLSNTNPKSYMNWPGKESGFVLHKKVQHSQQIIVIVINM